MEPMARASRNPLARVGQFLLDLVEIYVPFVSFSVMFLGFIVGIFFRYFLNQPLTWPQEVTIIAFIWTTLFGACLAKRMRSHVAFTLIYNRARPGTQLAIRLAGNSMILAAFVIAFYPTADFIRFMNFDKTPVMSLPHDFVYFPYLFFLVIVGGRTLVDLVTDIRRLAGRAVDPSEGDL